MLCSICNKNTAVVFVNKQDENGNTKLEGYCASCAKERGINPLENLIKNSNLTEKDLDTISKEIESIVSNMAENIDMDSISEQMNDVDPEELEEMEKNGGMPISFSAIPLGSIFSNMFSGGGHDESATSNSSFAEKKKVKIDKEKKKDKRRKTLETYGTNLTLKAKNGLLDMVIGRDKEIQRMIQILNRRSKNNPCLIGEPGVGKTAIAQGLAIKIATRKSTC